MGLVEHIDQRQIFPGGPYRGNSHSRLLRFRGSFLVVFDRIFCRESKRPEKELRRKDWVIAFYHEAELGIFLATFNFLSHGDTNNSGNDCQSAMATVFSIKRTE